MMTNTKILNLFNHKCHLLIFLLIPALKCSIFCQDLNYSALLLSLKGEGKYIRNEKEYSLSVPQSFLPGDKISVIKGNATLMLFSGDEISVIARNSYSIPSVVSSPEIAALVTDSDGSPGLLGQTGTAYQIRGEHSAFPLKSKISDKKNAIIHLSSNNIPKNPIDFKLVHSLTQKTVWETENLTDSVIFLQNAPLDKGQAYYWEITGLTKGKPVIGTIIYPNQTELNMLKEFSEKESHYDYLVAISYFYQKKYFFEAYSILEKAIKKYPSVEIYKKIQKTIYMH